MVAMGLVEKCKMIGLGLGLGCYSLAIVQQQGIACISCFLSTWGVKEEAFISMIKVLLPFLRERGDLKDQMAQQATQENQQ